MKPEPEKNDQTAQLQEFKSAVQEALCTLAFAMGKPISGTLALNVKMPDWEQKVSFRLEAEPQGSLELDEKP